MNFDAAIFDLDGTLLDTMSVWDGILAAPLAARGLPCPRDYVVRVHSLSFNEAAEYTVSRFGLQESPERLLDEWDALSLDEYANRVTLLPGAREYLSRLRTLGVRLAVATSLPERLYVPCLQRLGLTGSFDAFCSTDETRRGKSEPYVFLLAARRLGVEPSRCLVLDDSREALSSASRAGMQIYDASHGLEGAPLTGELMDLYDAGRVPTGETLRRGDPVPPGRYHLSVSGWIRDGQGRVLLTRRAEGKKYPLLWGPTGGHVLAGEDSLTAILREIREELGLCLDGWRASLIHSVRRERDFYDAWMFPAPEPFPELALQREEVCDAKWVTQGELQVMQRRSELHPLLNYCDKIGSLDC